MIRQLQANIENIAGGLLHLYYLFRCFRSRGAVYSDRELKPAA